MTAIVKMVTVFLLGPVSISALCGSDILSSPLRVAFLAKIKSSPFREVATVFHIPVAIVASEIVLRF